LKRVLRRVLPVLAGVVLLLAALGWYGHRRPLPALSGRVRVSGLRARVEIVRDRWGVPHVFAGNERDAYFGLGYATAQDRLFQLELHRRIAQGRLAEIFGRRALPADQLFRTMDLRRIAREQVDAARPEVREAFAAYADGINAAVREAPARPVELQLLGQEFEPARPDDFAGIIGYMAWVLNASWEMDPLYEDLVARVGEARAGELFPYDRGGTPPVFDAPASASATSESVRPRADLERALALVAGLAPGTAGSNTWIVAPSRSATGHALLANDPHLTHGLPTIWYEAHLHAPGLDVAGVTLPGVPFVIIGHNRRVALGLTNVMLDAADFFVEQIDGPPVRRVMSRGDWVPVQRRSEVIAVKGDPPTTMEVIETPHGPLVNHLLTGAKRPLSYQWVHAAARDANDFDAMYLVDHAKDWASFRDGVSRLGGIALNMSYADVDGHIGLQATGRFPRRAGRGDGNRFRDGVYGREEWDGFVPFEDNPKSFDPDKGWLAAANNPTLPEMPYFISSHWEPPDRALRIGERLAAKEKLTVDDMRALQADVTPAAWPLVRDAVREAFAPQAPSGLAAAVLASFLRWDGAMKADSSDAAVFGALFEHLFRETFGDEMGEDVAHRYRVKNNLWAIMVRAALEGRTPSWIDDTRTPAVEDRAAIVRRAFDRAVDELRGCCGADPARWTWGSRHTLELKHPMGAQALLRMYFNRGPFPVGGHVLTVNKAEFPDGALYNVTGSPSMRQIVDLGRPHDALSVIPAGQSGIPASPHYDDQAALWRRGEYHPLLMDRAAIDAVAEGTLVLEP